MPAGTDKLAQLQAVLASKFGEGSDMYRAGVEVFRVNARSGGPGSGIPPGYAKFWQAYFPSGPLHHVTTSASIESIKRHGLEPRDPFPRPWAGMLAVYMGDPSDPHYRSSERNILEHARAKGSDPVVLEIQTTNQLFRCLEPGRTSQVISLDPIGPRDIKVIILP